MDETYRMLGREHEADLEREALKWQRAADVRANAHAGDRPQHRSLWQPVNDRAPGAIRRLALRLGSIAAALRRAGMASNKRLTVKLSGNRVLSLSVAAADAAAVDNLERPDDAEPQHGRPERSR